MVGINIFIGPTVYVCMCFDHKSSNLSIEERYLNQIHRMYT